VIGAADIEALLADGREELRLEDAPVDNSALRAVRGVRRLFIERSPTLSSLATLDCPGLVELSLAGCEKLTARGLAKLAELTELEVLDLSGGIATDALLKKLALPRLRVLDISRAEGRSAITGAGLKKLEAPALEVLKMRGAHDAAGVWQGLARFPRLRSLDFTGGYLGERRGLKTLEALEELIAPDLRYTALGKAFFEELEAMVALRRVDLRGSRLEKRYLKQLAAKRPELELLHEELPAEAPAPPAAVVAPPAGENRSVPELSSLLRYVERSDGTYNRTVPGVEPVVEVLEAAAAEVDPAWLADHLAGDLEPLDTVAALMVAARVVEQRGLEPPLDAALIERVTDARTATTSVQRATPRWFLGALALDAVLDAAGGRLPELLRAGLSNRDRPHLAQRVLRERPSAELGELVVEVVLDPSGPAEVRWNGVLALHDVGKRAGPYADARLRALDGLTELLIAGEDARLVRLANAGLVRLSPAHAARWRESGAAPSAPSDEELRAVACGPDGDERLEATRELILRDARAALARVVDDALERDLPARGDVDRCLVEAAEALGDEVQPRLAAIARDPQRSSIARYSAYRAARGLEAWAERALVDEDTPAQLRALLAEPGLPQAAQPELVAALRAGPARVRTKAVHALHSRMTEGGPRGQRAQLESLVDDEIARALRLMVDEREEGAAIATRWLALLGAAEDRERVVEGAARAGGFVSAGMEEPLKRLLSTHRSAGPERESIFENAVRVGYPENADRLGAAIIARWAALRLEAGDTDGARAGAAEAARRDPASLVARRVLKALG
jgi:hypothetical protein